MAGSLDGPRLKLERANKHLHELGEALTTFGELQADRVRIQRYSKERRIEWFIEDPEEPPETLGPIVGDALYDMRSALDHLAYQLVLASGKKPSRESMFPVCGTAHQFACDSVTKLRGASIAVIAAVEKAQPYHPFNRFLGMLNRLANVDKHQHFHLLLNSMESSMLMGWPDDPGFYAGPIGKGRTVLIWGTIPKPEVRMDCQPIFDVTFADGPAADWRVELILRACFDHCLSITRSLGQIAGLEGSIDRLIWPPDGIRPSGLPAE